MSQLIYQSLLRFWPGGLFHSFVYNKVCAMCFIVLEVTVLDLKISMFSVPPNCICYYKQCKFTKMLITFCEQSDQGLPCLLF